MKKNVIITGQPRSGKSTLLKKVIQSLPKKVGFVTNEIRGEEDRLGFEIETNKGNKVILAHINSNTPNKVSRYFVDASVLNQVIPGISTFDIEDILYLDEIGQMQLFSERFKELTLSYLNSPNIGIFTLSKVFDDPFIKKIRERNDIILIDLLSTSRDEQEQFITKLLKKIEKARRYAQEPERFSKTKSGVELKSEHGTRTISYVDSKMECDCEFFSKYNICSHAIATQELIDSGRML